MICVIWHNSCTGDTLSFYQFFLHTCRCLSNLSLVNLLPCHYLLKKFSVTHQIKYKPLTLACKSFPDIAPICLLASSPPPLKKHSEVPPLAFVQSISLPALSLFSPPVLYPFLTIHPKRLSSYESLLDFFSYETEIFWGISLHFVFLFKVSVITLCIMVTRNSCLLLSAGQVGSWLFHSTSYFTPSKLQALNTY